MRYFFFAFMALTMSASTWGQAMQPIAIPARAPAPAAEMTTRLYDVRDLVLTFRDYPLSGALNPPTRIGSASLVESNEVGAGQAGATVTNALANPPVALATSVAALDQITKLITDTVAPETWKVNGGTLGAISEFNNELVITQKAENHDAIDQLLSELRQNSASVVRIRADWVLLASGQIEGLFKNGKDDTSALPEISRDLMAKLPAATVHFTADISCFSGQTVHLASGRARTMITGAMPVVANGASAYAPESFYVQYGLSLQVKPTTTTDSATLDLMSEASEARDDAPTTQPGGSIDRVNTVDQHFHTSVQVPLNKPVLIGGMTMDPTVTEPAGDQLYLIVEADAAAR
jgi:type II secretory pathway component GspD/PulD (secretin)